MHKLDRSYRTLTICAHIFLNGSMHVVVLIVSYVNMLSIYFPQVFFLFFLKIALGYVATIVAGEQICCMYPFNVIFE